MKKWIIASLVGGLILFTWQFFSWTISGIHSAESKYTPAQDSILSILNNTLQEDGMYVVPNCPPGSSWSEMEQLGKSWDGKPAATVIYRKANDMDMALPMTRGYLIDFLIVFCMIFVLTRGGIPKPRQFILGSFAVGFIYFLHGPYMAHNWFQSPPATLYGHLIDTLVGWTLTGAWLGWWLNRVK